MSTAPKGYPSTQKLDRVVADFASVVPVAKNQNGLSVHANTYVYLVGTDSAEALSTTGKIIATGIGAIAKRGDIIRFTSGTLTGVEVSVESVSTNEITLCEDLDVAPSAGNGFEINRFTHPTTTPGGGISASFSFTLDGASQAVTEDTVTPANSKPLPVKFILPQAIVASHNGATPSSVRLGDGTTLVGVTAANELKVKATTFAGRTQANPPVRHDYTVNVTTLAYTQLVASMAAAATKIQIFDSSGQTMVLAIGAPGSEVDQFLIFPGGVEIEYTIAAGSRVSIKAVSANATSGECSINFLT